MKKKLYWAAGLFVGVFVLGFIGYLGILLAGNYVIHPEDLVFDSASKIVDTNGKLVTKLYVQNRNPVPIQHIPESVQNAIVSVEDNRFYEHGGIDVKGISRALYTDILAGSKVEGGSTITQQLAKRVFLSSDKTWLRKTKEAIIAINLERRYSKKQILGMYLNQVYFGHGAYGIGTAADFYFHKKVKNLTVPEAALLAAIPNAPSYYSPIEHPKEALKRRNLVLTLMAKQGYISPVKAVAYKQTTLGLHLHQTKKHAAYWTYVDMVLQEAKDKYNLSSTAVYKGGYTFVVPMNIKAQKASYQLFQDKTYFPGSDPSHPPQGALVLLNPKSGGVLAVQGGRNYVRRGINRVNVKQQPGSTMKPLAVYGPALESKKYAPYSLLKDKKIAYPAFGGWEPHNYNGVYPGKMTMYDALRVSENAPAVWLLNQIGIPKSKKYLNKLGINIPDNGLSIALGGLKYGVTPLRMAAAYSAFDENGKVVKPYFISKIYDRSGKLIAKAHPHPKQVFSSQTAWYMTKMLQAVVKNGTATRGDVQTALAGKTGTTTDHALPGIDADAWFVGYTPKAVGAVWMGYDKTTKANHLTGGSSYPTLLFKDLLKQIPSQLHLSFQKPAGVHNLQSPIRLVHVKGVHAHMILGSFGLPSVKLSWSPAKDKRLVYHIYRVENGKKTRIGSVTGKETFTDQRVNPFAIPHYTVVPYNPQTKQEGKASNVVTTSWVPHMFHHLFGHSG